MDIGGNGGADQATCNNCNMAFSIVDSVSDDNNFLKFISFHLKKYVLNSDIGSSVHKSMILKLNMCRLRGNDERDWGPAGAPPLAGTWATPVRVR